MSRHTTRGAESDLIAKFLGNTASQGGPFALLAVSSDEIDDMSILIALRERLQQTANHPEGTTPEADEVRLALHAAAAQLLDPPTRQTMLLRWGPHSAAPRPAPPSSPATPENDRLVMMLQQDAVMAIAACGGWNDRAKSRVMMLALNRGCGPDDVQVAIARLEGGFAVSSSPSATPPSAPRAIPDHRSAQHLSLPEREAPTRRPRGVPTAVKIAVLITLAGIAIVIAAVIALSLPARPPVQTGITTGQSVSDADQAPAAPPRDTQGQLFPTLKPTPSSSAPVVTAPATNEAQRWLQRLTAASSGLDPDREQAIQDLIKLLRGGGSIWVDLEPAELAVALRCIVDTVYQADSVEEAERILDGIINPGAISQNRERILQSAWLSGVLSRLSVERDLPMGVLAAIDDRIARAGARERAASETAFESGVIANLIQSSNTVAATGTAEAWEGWLAATEAVAKAMPSRRTDLLLLAIGDALSAHTKPWNATLIDQAVTRIAWHREPQAQRWLLARFDGLDTSRDALTTLTRSIASKSSSPGIDITMVLPVGATEADRRRLRDDYASRFGLAGASDGAALDARVIETIARISAAESDSQSIDDALRLAAAWSRVSEAAWLRWQGLSDLASAALDRADAHLPLPSSPSPPSRASIMLRRDEPPTWTRSYINAGSDINARTSLLRSFPSSDIHPADAEVVMDVALRGTPAQVREAARAVVSRTSSTPVMVNALLEAISTAPRTASTAELITMLSGDTTLRLGDRNWRYDARRILVRRLLEMLASRGEYADADLYQAALADSHAVRSAPVVAAGTSPARASTSELSVFLAAERALWRSAAQDLTRPRAYPESLTQITSGSLARSKIASGSIQRDVVQMHEIAHLMGLVVASEHPERASEIWEIVSTLSNRLAVAVHVGAQVRDCQAATARIWAVRLRREESP
ncbi:MAG: hypothetical protein KIT19_14040 [Phycisphaeraceae bacterium]|nr:hypothetical protein [Phycisphaeraceae bacterium]